MKKLVMTCTMSMLASTIMLNAHASGNDKQNVLNTALRYGNSVHCNGVAFHEDSPLNSVFKIGDDEFAKYAVLQYVDLDCAGGSGTDSYILTPINPSIAGRFSVDLSNYPNGDMLEDLNINGKFIQSVSYDASRKYLTLTHLEYDDDDSNCCGSLKYRTIINLTNNRIVNQQFLGKER